MDYFYIWLILLIVVIVAEIATTEALVSIWFAIGSLVALILELLNFDVAIQIATFFLVSLLSVIFIRPIAAKYLRGNIVATNADRLIHQRTRLIKSITEDNYGEVKLNGVTWNCISDEAKPILKGSKVEILAFDGSKLVIRTVKEGDSLC